MALARAGGISFTRATRTDEPDLRRLLRETPMGGRYQVTLEREPDAFASALGAELAHDFIIARCDDSNEAIGLCERIVHACYVDGMPARLPYIGALRIVPQHRHRISLVRAGFDALRRLPTDPRDLPFALTSIAADNAPALRLLTAGLPGLPRYTPAGQLSTLFLRPRRARQTHAAIAPANVSDLASVARFLQNTGITRQFEPVWSEADLQALGVYGLAPSNFLVARRGDSIIGTIAVWDQRSHRQVVVRRYPAAVASLRPLINAAAPLLRAPPFPAMNMPINMAALSHVAVAQGDETEPTFLALVDAGLDQAWRRGFRTAMIGLETDGRWHRAIAGRHRCVTYETQLFLVHWPEDNAVLPTGTDRPVHPEVALF